LLVLDEPKSDGRILNVGTGKPTNLLELCSLLLDHLGKAGELEPQIVEQFREGDIRPCYADISAIQELGFKPTVPLSEGIGVLVDWVSRQRPDDRVATAPAELEQRSLVR
jgi:dTDP-L-rhamnose 4-epimerase